MMTSTLNFAVKSVQINAHAETAFAYISDPRNLPHWTNAFKEANEYSALMVTPQGELRIKLKTERSKALGTIDWYMTMPDGTEGIAFSRVMPNNDNSSIYTFVLLAPPVPLEELEGTLTQQSRILEHELKNLVQLLDGK